MGKQLFRAAVIGMRLSIVFSLPGYGLRVPCLVSCTHRLHCCCSLLRRTLPEVRDSTRNFCVDPSHRGLGLSSHAAVSGWRHGLMCWERVASELATLCVGTQVCIPACR
jgi:hypothetical protein